MGVRACFNMRADEALRFHRELYGKKVRSLTREESWTMQVLSHQRFGPYVMCTLHNYHNIIPKAWSVL